jgi:hypothetical protein
LRSVWVARNPPGFAFVEFEDARWEILNIQVEKELITFLFKLEMLRTLFVD